MVKVSAAIVTHKGKTLLFLRDNKPNINDPGKWSLIGGHVEKGETHRDALFRELKEEINIRPEKYKFLLKTKGFWGEEIYLYHIPLNDLEASRIRIGGEGQKVKFFKIADLEKLPLSTNLSAFFKESRPMFEKVLTELN